MQNWQFFEDVFYAWPLITFKVNYFRFQYFILISKISTSVDFSFVVCCLLVDDFGSDCLPGHIKFFVMLLE